MISGRLILLALFLGISLPNMAGVFRWEDQSGQIHFSNVPPEPIEDYRFGTWSSEFTRQKAEAAKKKGQTKKLSKIEYQKKPSPETTNMAKDNLPEVSTISDIPKSYNGEFTSPEENKNKNQELSAADIEKEQLDKCGVFKTYVRDYKDKLTPGCQSNVCKIYVRQLLKYKTKLKKYCK